MQHPSSGSALASAALLLLVSPTKAQEPVGSAEPQLDNVTIIGHRRDARDVPGSAHVIDQEQLEVFLQSDVMRVLRTVPGVYLQEEDGFGLRPNIGIRGSGLDRSARIALLEDGVLIAPAPYAASSAYYFPTQRRMHALEVLKGPAAITVGPRTTGGAINLISTPIPDEFSANADVRLGGNSSFDTHLNMGNRGERFSWLLETVQSVSDGFKYIDGPGVNDTGYDIEDYLVKLQFDSDPTAPLYQSFRLKAGYTDQISDETYLGLTEADFAADPFRRYAGSRGDQFTSDHEQLQLGYVVRGDSLWEAEITAYRNNFARNWFKLRSVNGVSISDIVEDPQTYATEYAYMTGASDSPDDALLKRHNNREYVSQGVQGSVSWDLSLGDSALSVTAGARLHQDEEDRLQQQDSFRMENMQLVQTSTGALGSTTNRLSKAEVSSIFLSSEIENGNWIFTPGVRFEDITMTRFDYAADDADRSEGPTRVRENSISVVIPGMGAMYKVNDNWRLLAGVHKGFNPPGPGSSAKEESSVNFEFGLRYGADALNVEAIYFVNDYENLVGTVTASTGGGTQIGDQFDGGEVAVQGLELSAGYAFEGLRDRGFTVPLNIEYTWTTEAEFHSAFKSGFDPWGDVEVGDELPYIPEHQLRATAGIKGQSLGVSLAANYIGRMRTVAGQGAFEPSRTVDSRVVWDLVGRWRFSDRLASYVKVDNLFDKVYVAARRPAGLRPGLERMAWLGLSYEL